MLDYRFDGRVAIVTGGGRGLGRAYAELLASRGASVVVNDPGVGMDGSDIGEGPAREVARAICEAGGHAIASTASVATPEGGQQIIDAALDAFGQIDILIHNAGILTRKPVTQISLEEFDRVLSVHLYGAFHVGIPAFRHMVDQGYGRIVLTSSINGIYGKNNSVDYASAKGGLIAMSHTFAIEGEAHGVQSNAILPAAVTRLAAGFDTSHLPPMEPENVAPLVAWLAHEECAISGEMFLANSGRYARAFVCETTGTYDPAWTIEAVAARSATIRDVEDRQFFPVLPHGHADHSHLSHEMAHQAIAAAKTNA